MCQLIEDFKISLIEDGNSHNINSIHAQNRYHVEIGKMKEIIVENYKGNLDG